MADSFCRRNVGNGAVSWHRVAICTERRKRGGFPKMRRDREGQLQNADKSNARRCYRQMSMPRRWGAGASFWAAWDQPKQPKSKHRVAKQVPSARPMGQHRRALSGDVARSTPPAGSTRRRATVETLTLPSARQRDILGPPNSRVPA